MSGVYTRWARGPGRPLRWGPPLMFVLPFALAAVAHVLARLSGGSLIMLAEFRPDPWVARCAVGLGVVYAGVFMLLMNRLRLALLRLPARGGARSGGITVRFIWGLGLALWLWMATLGSFLVCGAVNQMSGTATTERARILSKHEKQGTGCHREIGVVSVSAPAGQSVCVSSADWNRIQPGDSVTLLTIDSGLGRAVGLPADAPSHLTRSAP